MSADALIDPPKLKLHRLPSDPSQLYCLLDVLPVAAYVCDSQGLITYFNPLAEQIWGLVPQLNDATQRFCGSFKLCQGDGSTLRNDDSCMARTLQTGREFQGEEVLIERPDAIRVIVQIHTHPFHDAFGKISGAVAVLVDVTSRKQAESQLAAINQELVCQIDELQESHRRKDDFLARLAHELRNPLAPINNSLQILSYSKDLSQSLVEVRSIMHRQVQKLVNLLDDAQDVARLARNGFDLSPHPVRLDVVINQAVHSVRTMIELSNHRLTLSLPEEACFLNADVGRLAQVFTNLLNNAVQHSAPGSEIAVHARQEENQAVVTVHDSGSGIPPEMLPQIFDMYARTDGTSRRGHGGLGVGLTVAKHIVERHGGQIEAHSQGAGHGSAFHVRLPLLRTLVPTEQATQVQQPATPAKTESTNPGHCILVVDDIKSAAYVLSRLLQALGQQVHTADCADAALEVARRERPDIIISDITMPGVDGYELARWLRQEPALQHSILVALTGHGEDQDREQSKAAGFHHHLVKPVDVEDLRKLIQSVPLKRS
jgi:signal transduction histidine kinase/ActR/RegA family two-component response regulator